MEIFKVFKVLTKEKQRYFMRIVFCMLVGAILETVGIGAILPLISVMGQGDFLLRHPQLAEALAGAGISSHTGFIIAAAAALIVFYVLKNLYIGWMLRMQMRFSLDNQVEYAGNLMNAYLNKDYLYHVEHNSANILRNVSAGPQVIFSAILVNVFTLLTEVITAAMIWVMLVMVDAFTAIVMAAVMGIIMYGIVKAFRRRITRQGEIQSQYSAEYTKWLNQGLGAIKETKVLRKEDYFYQEFSRNYKQFGDANQVFMFLNQVPRLMIETLVTGGLLILIISKLAMGYEPMDIVPLLGVLALAAFRLMPCANRIVNMFNGIKFNMPFFNIVYEDLLEAKELVYTRRQEKVQVVRIPFEQSINIEKLSFQYPQGKELVLDNISFSIPKGSFCGIIGPSGAGKTTFVDILLGLLQPTGGRISIDTQDIAENLGGWQMNLSYVPQSIYLIDGSIKENIALGVPYKDIDDDKIKKVLQMAELYDFVAALPDKLETMVGERGVKLSGGQRQRIGIARALYYEPEVLILDEATSALDNETEKNITETILKLKGQITIIAIAHRVSTLEECDFKVKFENGRIETV
ncbi:MAG: ABC transporter ATP-binding protein [Bacteroidales bacterium]|nr:ABC transporter ATP-binding protein [Bacteroidales bacterium]